MKIIKIVYNIISAVMIIAIILLIILSLLLGISGMDKQNPKSVFGLRAFIVKSGSMSPTFDTGSIIIVQETSEEKLKERDIITVVKGEDTLLTHRIVTIDKDDTGISYITRGDANPVGSEDSPIKYDSILGKTILYMNGVGTFIENLKTPLGLGLMIASIILILFVLPYIISVAEEKSKPKIEVDSIDSGNSSDENVTEENELELNDEIRETTEINEMNEDNNANEDNENKDKDEDEGVNGTEDTEDMNDNDTETTEEDE